MINDIYDISYYSYMKYMTKASLISVCIRWLFLKDRLFCAPVQESILHFYHKFQNCRLRTFLGPRNFVQKYNTVEFLNFKNLASFDEILRAQKFHFDMN